MSAPAAEGHGRLTPGYFDAPAARLAPLSAYVPTPRLPEVTMVFCAIDGCVFFVFCCFFVCLFAFIRVQTSLLHHHHTKKNQL